MCGGDRAPVRVASTRPGRFRPGRAWTARSASRARSSFNEARAFPPGKGRLTRSPSATPSSSRFNEARAFPPGKGPASTAWMASHCPELQRGPGVSAREGLMRAMEGMSSSAMLQRGPGVSAREGEGVGDILMSGQFRLQRGPGVSAREGVLRNYRQVKSRERFNEARAFPPGKGLVPLHRTQRRWRCFNEARAFPPGKGSLLDGLRGLCGRSFNEARAFPPGKGWCPVSSCFIAENRLGFERSAKSMPRAADCDYVSFFTQSKNPAETTARPCASGSRDSACAGPLARRPADPQFTRVASVTPPPPRA